MALMDASFKKKKNPNTQKTKKNPKTTPKQLPKTATVHYSSKN